MIQSKSMKHTTLVASMALAVGIATGLLGCSLTPTVASAVVNDKVYAVVPDAIKVKAGIVTGDLTDLKGIKRVEEARGASWLLPS